MPVFQGVACSLLWKYGYLDGLFLHLGHDGALNIEYGKVMPMPKKHLIDAKEVAALFTSILNMDTDGLVAAVMFGSEEVNGDLIGIDTITEDFA